jgi:integrase
MQAFIGAMLLTSKETQPQGKPFEIYDSRLPGFTLRVQPSGVRSYYARFGRNRRVVLGKVGTLAPEEARERCQRVLGNVAHGRHPLHGLRGTDGITLGMFIADTYTTWVKASRPRTAANTLEKLHRLFRTWYPEPLTAITIERIESWKTRRLNAGRSAATVLRDLFALSIVLRRAVRAGELTENPAEVLKLRWTCVDFDRRLLTVEGRNAKNRQTRRVPLNEEAMSALRRWREQSGSGTRLFDVATGFRTAWEKLLKRATITRFRWHDLRHHFASRLVQHGVPLNTVRDLLGHSSVAMSLRYAHLAPGQRREAVAKLNDKPLLALTMHLQWEGFPAGNGLSANLFRITPRISTAFGARL